MKKILFIEMWNCSPHLETSLELAKLHADNGDKVTYIFGGHDTPYTEGISLSAKKAGFLTELPERKGINLINNKNIKFINRIKLPKLDINEIYKFKDLKELIEYKYKDFSAGLGVASSLISNTKNSTPKLDELDFEIQQMLESCIRVYEFTLATIQKESPDLMYVFNGRFCNHRPIMEAAKKLKIKTIFHERGATKHLYDLTDSMPHDQDQIARNILQSWNKANKTYAIKIAKDFFEDRFYKSLKNRNKESSIAQRTLQLPTIDKSKKIYTYFSSSDDEYVAVGDVFKWTGWAGQIEAVNDLIKICEQRDDIQLFIRIHPYLSQKSLDDQNKWLNLNLKNKYNLLSFDSEVDSYLLIDMSDVVITSGSTTGMEAAFKGKPTITLGPAYYSDIGATYKAENYYELENLIIHKNLIGDSTKAFPYGFYMSTFGINFKYYNPTSLYSGLFMGVDLQEKTNLWYLFNHYKNKICNIFNLIFYKFKIY